MAHDQDPGSALNDEPTVVRRPSQRTRSSNAPESLVRSVPPGTRESATARSTVGGSSTGSSGLHEVLEAEEVTRTHGFSRVIAVVSFAVIPVVIGIGGTPLALAMCVASLAAAGAMSTLVWRRTRLASPEPRYHRALFRAYGWVLVVAVAWIEYYCGFFSPVPVVITLGIYYLGQSVDRHTARVLPLFTAGSYVGLALLTALGVLEDVGMFRADDTAVHVKIFATLTSGAVLLSAASLARLSRRALHQAIDASRDALLVAQQKAAQLAEANHQLDHALRAAVGKPGRHTGQLAGEYTLGVVIGVGAIGEVYRATHSRTGELAAVKLLQVDALLRPGLVERFLREGEIAQRLSNPHVTRVLAVGRMSDGAPFITMELLTGRDLASRLRQDGPLSLPELSRLAQQLGAALEHAHAAGIVHRDLKPLNVYEAEQGGATVFKVLDFGISKVESSTGTLTQEGVVGTPGYMSPEQARGGKVDRRSDVFSMGVLLYRAATGQPAFAGDNTPQIMFDIVYKSPARPSSIVRELPRELDWALAVALAKAPEQRFQSAADLADAFIKACAGEAVADLRARAQACIRAQPWGKPILELARIEAS